MRPLACSTALLGIVLAGSSARAQLVIDPDGPPPVAPTPPPATQGQTQGGTVQGGGTTLQGPNGSNIKLQVVGADDKPKTPEGVYLGPNAEHVQPGDRYTGRVPEVHVVQRHDTLWDICAYYFGDAWRWPEIWALNPSITNPHWIYPGNLVRLVPAGATPQAPVEPPTATPQAPVASSAVELRQIAFVSINDLKVAGKVKGSTEEKAMLSLGDEVYLDYSEGQPPQVGSRYSIYAPTKEITHPQTKQKIGAFVLVRGELKILDVKKGKTARGLVTYITQQGVIERGDRVGTLRTQFKAVTPVPATKNVEGLIVAIMGMDELIGEHQIVLIDRGKTDGVVVGNPMSVVRRGDAYQPTSGSSSSEGMNDRRYPDKYLADIIVVDVGQNLSVAAVTRSDKEIGIGDRILMRVAR